MTRALLCTLLASCAPPGAASLVRGPLLTPAGQATTTIVGKCTGVDARPVADRVLAALSSELVRRGSASYDQVRDALSRPLQMCVVDKPTPCCNSGGCRGPCLERTDGVLQCARKAGCTDGYSVWASKLWPPVCDDLLHVEGSRWKRWPDEPHCAAASKPHDWRGTLADELVHVAELRVLRAYDPEHKTSPELYPIARAAAKEP